MRSNQREFKTLNLDVLQDAVRAGRIVPPANGAPITARDLHDAGLVGLRRRHAGVKLLARGKGRFDVKLNIEVQEATRRAIEAVEAAGGSLTTVYYSPLTRMPTSSRSDPRRRRCCCRARCRAAS